MSGARLSNLKAIHLMLADEAPSPLRLQMQAWHKTRSSHGHRGRLGLASGVRRVSGNKLLRPRAGLADQKAQQEAGELPITHRPGQVG